MWYVFLELQPTFQREPLNLPSSRCWFSPHLSQDNVFETYSPHLTGVGQQIQTWEKDTGGWWADGHNECINIASSGKNCYSYQLTLTSTRSCVRELRMENRRTIWNHPRVFTCYNIDSTYGLIAFTLSLFLSEQDEHINMFSLLLLIYRLFF